MSTINVVLDIDGVLCCHSATYPKNASYYLKKGLIISAIKTHYVFSGVIEFIQLLFSTENIRVSFISSSDVLRNKIFVKELLEQALGEEQFKKIEKDVVVLSKDDLSTDSDHDCMTQYQTYGLHHGNYKKDISKVLREKDKLPNAILIDDDETYTKFGQETNILKTRWVQDYDFYNWGSTKEIPNEMPYSLLTQKKLESDECYKETVIHGTAILVIKLESGYELGFLNDKTYQYEQRAIPTEEYGQLIDSLDKVFNESTSKCNRIEIEDKDQLKILHKCVNSFGGNTRIIFHKINQICYITGLLFKSMKTAQEEGVYVTDVLFRSQFKVKQKEPLKYKPNYYELIKQAEFYLYGLKKLKEINPDFCFSTPQSYFDCINSPPSEDEKRLIEEAVSDEETCVIM